MLKATLLRRALLSLAAVAAAATLVPAAALAAGDHMTTTFAGVKVNGGTVSHAADTLTLSADFKVPDAPAPHWQVVDSKGNVYLLQRLVIKGDKLNKTITLPSYVSDVAKVQIWCAWAEVLLGEASFPKAVMVAAK
ncbi:MAG TPA: hypothetical protein VJV23_11775 [Candidatus Polarisedimenticolia bacterium]|nr:hypothetical protein [Candidatus Polarisedimenticolia bacterium]